MSRMDVAIFGGGPAGLAAALALRLRGCSVAVYDAQHPPIHKTCGEGLMPEALRLLHSFGVILEERDGAHFTGISFHDAQQYARARLSNGTGLGVGRTRLHQRMADRAADLGIVLHWGTVVRPAGSGFTVAGTPLHAGFFVIADGICSTLASPAGFCERTCHSTRYASRQQFSCAPWSDSVEVHWRRREQLYVTPLSEGEVGVVLLTGTRGRRVSDALEDFPAAAQRLRGAMPTSPTRGAVTRTRTVRDVVRGNVALLGDASGSVDAVTGEGLLSAFRQAQALADAIAAGEPMRYVTAHREIERTPQRMARLLLLLDRYPWLERPFLTAMASRPEAFAALLRVHLGEQSWKGFAQREALSLLLHKRAGSPPIYAAEPDSKRGL